MAPGYPTPPNEKRKALKVKPEIPLLNRQDEEIRFTT